MSDQFFSCLDFSDRNKTCLPSPPEGYVYIARTLKMTLFVSMRRSSFRTEENSVVSLVDGCKKMNPHT